MAQCIYVDPETGEQCKMTAQVLSGNGLCVNHDPALVEAKLEWSARGGRASKKVEPADVPELRQLLGDMLDGTNADDIVSIKKVVVKAMADLLDAKLTPTQFRALCGSGISVLKDVIALDYYRQLVERVERLESGGEPRQLEGGDEWQVSRSED